MQSYRCDPDIISFSSAVSALDPACKSLRLLHSVGPLCKIYGYSDARGWAKALLLTFNLKQHFLTPNVIGCSLFRMTLLSVADFR